MVKTLSGNKNCHQKASQKLCRSESTLNCKSIALDGKKAYQPIIRPWLNHSDCAYMSLRYGKTKYSYLNADFLVNGPLKSWPKIHFFIEKLRLATKLIFGSMDT